MSLMCGGGGDDDLTPEEKEANSAMNKIATELSKEDEKVRRHCLLAPGAQGWSSARVAGQLRPSSPTLCLPGDGARGSGALAPSAAISAHASVCGCAYVGRAQITKMLLLGAGESGKSTIFKQMKVINKNGYTEKERKEFVSVVMSNAIAAIKALLGAYATIDEPMPGDVSSMKSSLEAVAAFDDEKVDSQVADLLAKLWAHASIQNLYQRRSEFQLNDSADYFLNKVNEIAAADYIPTVDDVLHSRIRTTGIVQSDFHIKNMMFAMFDVGGQRNERRKWIHCFDNVNAVVFVAALSEFDQMLFEDENQSRLVEAIDLWSQIVNSKWFKTSSVILFLNKKDLFEKKLREGKVYKDFVNGKKFLDYEYVGSNEMKPCAEHMKKAFVKMNKNPDKSIYSHITTAIDTSNVKFVFNAVVAMILEANLKASGLA